MLTAAGSLAAVAVLVVVGVVMARRGWLNDTAVDGLKAVIVNVTLPLLLFRAFLQLELEGRVVLLALTVFVACGVMGVIGVLVTRLHRLPAPETRLLFQGFEAGMLGYALLGPFTAPSGSPHSPRSTWAKWCTSSPPYSSR